MSIVISLSAGQTKFPIYSEGMIKQGNAAESKRGLGIIHTFVDVTSEDWQCSL